MAYDNTNLYCRRYISRSLSCPLLVSSSLALVSLSLTDAHTQKSSCQIILSVDLFFSLPTPKIVTYVPATACTAPGTNMYTHTYVHVHTHAHTHTRYGIGFCRPQLSLKCTLSFPPLLKCSLPFEPTPLEMHVH